MTCDVIVIGAGPAGSAAAASAARAGLTVWLLDRGLPPVPHLPESWAGRSIPLLRTIGIDDVKPAMRPRTAVRFLAAHGRFGVEVTLSRAEGCDEPAAIRLDRARFDELLVRNAISQGASFRPLHTVTEVTPSVAAGYTTVACATPQGGASLRCRYLIDATGKSALVAGQLGARRPSAPLDPRQAVFTHFRTRPGHRFAEPDTMTVIGIEHGYVFVIPLGENRVSVGVVVGAQAARRHDGDLTQLFWTHLDEVTCFTDLLAGADQLLPVIPALNAEFRADAFAGDGYALAGDAAAFTDPFFSSGIDLAIETGILAGRTAAAVLEAPGTEARAEATAAYGEQVRGLLDAAERDTEYARLGAGLQGDLLNALADPHLPTVLPLLAVLQGARSGPLGGDAHRALVRDLRDGFEHAGLTGEAA